MTKILKIAFPGKMTGGWFNPFEDEIVVDSRLDSYPRLQEYIMKHELRHAEIKDVVRRHFTHDLKAMYESFADPELREEHKRFKKGLKYPRRLKYKIMIMNGILNFLSPFVWIGGSVSYLSKKLRRKMNLKKVI